MQMTRDGRFFLENGKVVYTEIFLNRAILCGFKDLDKISLVSAHEQSLKFLENSGVQVSDFPENIPDFTDLEERRKRWFIPEKFMDYEKSKDFILKKCRNEKEKKRVEEELKEFEKRNMTDLVCFFVYFSEIIREKKLFVGVGRGSSCCLLILHLLGIHKVNPLKYDLPLSDFFKENGEYDKYYEKKEDVHA